MAPVRLAYNTYVPIGGVDTSLSPVLFLHGMALAKENWGDIPQIVANATKRKVFSLDARNHGDSEWTEEFTFDLNADDLLDFMEKQKINKAIIVGHCMGGTTGIKAALKRPEKIEKLIVEEMFVKTWTQFMLQSYKITLGGCGNAVEALPANLDEDAAKEFIGDYIYSNFLKKMNITRRHARGDLMFLRKDENGRYVFKANGKVLERCLGEDSESMNTASIGKYEGPACFIYGKRSFLKVYNEVDHIREHFPNAVFEGIDGAPHLVHQDFPAEFTNVLLKFIAPLKSHF